MSHIKDIGWLLLIGLLLPLLMPLAMASLLVIVVRQVYWWARGNTTGVSRRGERARSSGTEPWREPTATPVAERGRDGRSSTTTPSRVVESSPVTP